MDTLIKKLAPTAKRAPTNTEIIRVKEFGVFPPNLCKVYLYVDVLEELVFAAKRQSLDFSCLLTGSWFIDVEKAFEFVQIEGFRELIPVDDSLEFSKYLRKNRALLKSDPSERVVGACHLRKNSNALLSPADVLIHRSFFNYSYQLSLVLDEKNDRLAIYLFDESQRLRDSGLYVISQRSAPVDALAAPPPNPPLTDISEVEEEEKEKND